MKRIALSAAIALAWASTASADTLQEAASELAAGNVAAGSAILDRLCRGGDAQACGLSGMVHMEPKYGVNDMATGRLRMEAACDGGLPDGCMALATLRYTGQGGPVDKAGALAAAETACAAGAAPACAGAKDLRAELASAVPGAAAPTTPDGSESVAFYEQVLSLLRKDCTLPPSPSPAVASRVIESCTARESTAVDTALGLPDGTDAQTLGVAGLSAAKATTESLKVFESLAAQGLVTRDQWAVQCSGAETAEFLLSQTTGLRGSPLETALSTVRSDLDRLMSACPG